MKKSMQDISDTGHLRAILCSYTQELSLTFLERRGKYNNHKSTILEELQDVITELTHREKDLLTAVQIALSALDTNDKLQLKHSKTKTKLVESLEKNHHQSIDIETLRESLINAENRYENINKTLIETEELMLENSAELNRMLRERFYDTSAKNNEDELENITKEYKTQISALQKKKWELEKEKSQLVQQNTSQEKSLQDYKEAFEKLEEKLEKFTGLHRDSEKSNKALKERIESLECQLKTMHSSYERLKFHSEKLEEDLSLPSNSSPVTPQPKLFHSLSLQNELEIIEDELSNEILNTEKNSIVEVLYLSSNDKCKTPQTRTSSLSSFFRPLSTDAGASIQVSPYKEARKKPPEEYFALSVQAVKMNSPHMDNIIRVNPSELYGKAIQAGIPFHKWYMWIESQLNSIYVQALYKKSNKTLWRRYSGKMCLGKD